MDIKGICAKGTEKLEVQNKEDRQRKKEGFFTALTSLPLSVNFEHSNLPETVPIVSCVQ